MDKIAIQHTIELLKKKNFKEKFIKKVNKNVDIPLLNEKTEKKIYDSIYKMILQTIEEM